MDSDETATMEGLKTNLRKESRKLHLDFNELKSGGFIKQTQKNLFTVRLRCPGGKVTSDKMRKAAEIAEKYGRGEVHISVRQSIEVPYVHYKHFDEIDESLRELKWSVESCGQRVRVRAHRPVLREPRGRGRGTVRRGAARDRGVRPGLPGSGRHAGRAPGGREVPLGGVVRGRRLRARRVRGGVQ